MKGLGTTAVPCANTGTRSYQLSFGQPDDIARIAVFLAASEDSAWLTGERQTASGGYR